MSSDGTAKREHFKPLHPWLREQTIAALEREAAQRGMPVDRLAATILERVAETPRRIAVVVDRATRS